jgi:hypothetical protein
MIPTQHRPKETLYSFIIPPIFLVFAALNDLSPRIVVSVVMVLSATSIIKTSIIMLPDIIRSLSDCKKVTTPPSPDSKMD